MGTAQTTQIVGSYKTTSFSRGISKKIIGRTLATRTVQTTKLQGILLSDRLTSTNQAPDTVKTVQIQAFSVANEEEKMATQQPKGFKLPNYKHFCKKNWGQLMQPKQLETTKLQAFSMA